MKKQVFFRFVCIIGMGYFSLFFSLQASAQTFQPGSVITKGAFVERYFINKMTRPPAARKYVPESVEKLSPAEQYQAVVKGLTEKGILILTGSRPDEPLTRIDFITLTYLLAGGTPTQSLGSQKALLKEKGVLDPMDIGLIKGFQGDVTFTRLGKDESIKITGAEAVLFRDLDETEFGARVELQFDDGSTLAIGEDTSVNIDEMVYDPKTRKRSVRIRVAVGTIMVNATKNTHPDSKFEVVTPTLVAGVRGTKFGTTVQESGKSSVLTTEGSVVVCPFNPKDRRFSKDGQPLNCVAPDIVGPKSENKENEVRGVLVNQGQKTEALVGETKLEVATASEEAIQKLLDDTKVVETTQLAVVKPADAEKADIILQIEISSSTTGSVDSNQDILPLKDDNPIKDDPSQVEDRTTQLGLSEISSNQIIEPEPLSIEEQLAGLSGAELKAFFLGLTDQQQADLFGTLTTEQQRGLVALLSKQEAEDLLNRFQPNSPFTDAVLNSLLDFTFVLSAEQLGQLVDNVTEEQATELVQCDSSLRDCIIDISDLSNPPSGVSLDGTNGFGLTSFGSAVSEALRQEILSLLGLPPDSPRYVYVAGMLTRTLGNLEAADTQEINDLFGGGFLGYSVNGGIQAGELLENPNGPNAGQRIDISSYIASQGLNDGFLSYVEQLSEDFSNAAALLLINSPTHEDITNQILNQENDRKSLLDLVTSQLELSTIRERDAQLDAIADARAGAVIRDNQGRLTRISQYVARTRPDEVQVLNITDTDGSEIRLAYIDFRTTFAEGSLIGKTSTQIRDLPWNDYLTTLYSGDVATCSASLACSTMVGSPAGSPELVSMSVQQGQGKVITDSAGNLQSGFYRRRTREFAERGADNVAEGYNYDGVLVEPNFEHQLVTRETFSIREEVKFLGGIITTVVQGTATVGVGGGTPIMNDPRAGSSLSANLIPPGEFRFIPRRYGAAYVNTDDITAGNYFPEETENPEGFILRSIGALTRLDSGAVINYTSVERFVALGTSTDASPGANVITGLSDVKIDSIWDALRVGQPGVSQPNGDQPALGQGLPTIDIGGNLLQFRGTGGIYVPWNRMIWKDASGNWPTSP